MMKRFLLLLLTLLVPLTLASCFGGDDDDDGEITCDNIQELLDTAYTSLENTLYIYTQPDGLEPDHPDDIDFSAPRALYRNAYDCEPTNLEARLGLALMDMMTVMMDPDVNAAFDLWETYLEDNTPFESSEKSGRPLGVNLGLPTGTDHYRLPVEIVSFTVMANARTLLTAEEPQISEIQDILRDVVLPKLSNAVALLEPVAASANFQFLISGRMQGDPADDDVEVDQADICAMLAMCRLMVGAVNTAVAYDMQFPTYDDAGIIAGLDRASGNVMSLRPGFDVSAMMNIPQFFLDAFDDVETGIESLLAETDFQDDDLIRRDPGDIDDLNEILDDVLPQARALFTAGGHTFTEDFDDDPMTPDQDLTIDLYAFFTSPVTDWKMMVPPYTVTAETRPCGWDSEYEWNLFLGDYDLFVPAGFYSYNAYYSTEIYGFTMMWSSTWNSFPEFTDVCAAIVDTEYQALLDDPLWHGHANFYFQGNGPFTPGATNTVSIYWERYVEQGDLMMWVPVITFTDTVFEDWIDAFPDPTMNGLLPDMQSGQDIVDFFGIESEGWDPQVVITWFDCGDDYGRPNDLIGP